MNVQETSRQQSISSSNLLDWYHYINSSEKNGNRKKWMIAQYKIVIKKAFQLMTDINHLTSRENILTYIEVIVLLLT